MYFVCIITFLFCTEQVCNGALTAKVQVEQGTLEGPILVPSTGRGQYYSFKGIPYAAPPIGKLRFKEPYPPQKWTGVRNATEHGSVCFQLQSVTGNEVIGNEDCLFLNVYSPDIYSKNLMPVMVFIHGGFFVTGSGNSDLYGPDFLVGYGVVLVTINYRLDTFGFLSVDTKDVPGNAALKDQVAALKWVKENIKVFGGDPDNITIFGQSAGGVSVTYHLVSPVSKGLFKRTIVMSSSLFNDFATSFDHKRRAFELGRRLGTNTSDPYELIDYLQNVPPEKLITVRPDIRFADEVTYNVLKNAYFVPIIEKELGGYHFITEQPYNLKLQGKINDADIMIGHTPLEGLRNTLNTQDVVLKYYPKFKELYVPLKISNIRSIQEVLIIGDKIHDYYFGNSTLTLKTIRSFVEYESYAFYIYDVYSFVENIVPENLLNRLYFYVFTIYSSRNFYSQEAAERYGIKEATHRDDLPYLFDGPGYNYTVDVNSLAFKYVKEMCTLYTNFAKYGTPTPDNSLGLIWPSYGKEKNTVTIDATLIKGNVQNDRNIGFWRSIYRDAGVKPYVE